MKIDKTSNMVYEAIQKRAMPVSLLWLTKTLGIDKHEIKSSLNKLLREKKITRSGGKLFDLPARQPAENKEAGGHKGGKVRGGKRITPSGNLFTGRIEAHPGGYAFFVPDNGGEDLFVPAAKLGSAVHGDRVKVKKGRFRGRVEGHVVDVIERKLKLIVGRVEVRRRHYNVVPFNRRFPHTLFVRKAGAEYADGDVVVCNIKRYPDHNNDAEGEITKLLGNVDDKGIENLIVMSKYELTREFPAEVEAQAAEAALSLPEEGINKGREDFRKLFTVTIDGETARDFDDAISVEKTGDGWILYVHIADVAHYVRQGTALDSEAYRRGTSVYFPEFAIPMLPEILSNGVCSLRPGEDRFAMSVKISYNKAGERKSSSFYQSVIKSKHRLTYTYVNKLLEAGTNHPSVIAGLTRNPDKIHRGNPYSSILDHGSESGVTNIKLLELMNTAAELTEALKKRRKKQGTIDFDLPDVEFRFDENGDIAEILPEERGASERIIEHLMIETNEAVAELLDKKAPVSIFRIHGSPDMEKLIQWAKTVRTFGISVGKIPEKVNPDTVQKWFEVIEGRPYSYLLKSMLVRSMQRAEYADENIGHFGLASEYYTHFTSPIRRYPDLIVHRLLKRCQFKEKITIPEGSIETAAPHTSVTERNAEEAEREVHLYKKLAYLRRNAGDIYDADINRVTATGFYVFLEKLLMSGFVDIASLPKGRWFADTDNGVIHGKGGIDYKLGDWLQVAWISTDWDRLEASFSPAFENAGDEEEVQMKPRKFRRKRR